MSHRHEYARDFAGFAQRDAGWFDTLCASQVARINRKATAAIRRACARRTKRLKETYDVMEAEHQRTTHASGPRRPTMDQQE